MQSPICIRLMTCPALPTAWGIFLLHTLPLHVNTVLATKETDMTTQEMIQAVKRLTASEVLACASLFVMMFAGLFW